MDLVLRSGARRWHMAGDVADAQSGPAATARSADELPDGSPGAPASPTDRVSQGHVDLRSADVADGDHHSSRRDPRSDGNSRSGIDVLLLSTQRSGGTVLGDATACQRWNVIEFLHVEFGDDQ